MHHLQDHHNIYTTMHLIAVPLWLLYTLSVAGDLRGLGHQLIIRYQPITHCKQIHPQPQTSFTKTIIKN